MRNRPTDAGFSLAALIFFLTAASIFIAAAVPSYQMQAKRQTEEELIFRGEEYARAIQKYQRKFGVYPSSIDQLVSTNGLRFLRRAYQDPVTGKGFRLITVNPDGSVTGSKVFTSNVNTQPLFGNTQTFGQQQTPQQQQMQQGIQNAQQGIQQGSQQAQQAQQDLLRSQQQFGVRGQQPGFQGGGQQQLSGLPQQQQQQQRGQQPTAPGGGNPAGGTPIGSGGIIGVASDSSKESIKIYNKRQKYDEWEFIAILGQTAQNTQNTNPGANPAGTNPGGNNPNAPNPFGGNRGFNPGTPSPSPFGGPGGSPLGPAGGGMPVQNPLGFGGPPQQPPVQPRK